MENVETIFSESLATDLAEWTLGPYHTAFPGPLKLHLSVDGEVIVSCRVERGFAHKGLEKALELHEWPALIPYGAHIDPEASVFGEMAIASAVERIAGIEIPPRAQAVRLLLCELTRISLHLASIVKIAKAVQSETVAHYVLRDRERILDLFELLTGARFSFCFLKYGGVVADVTEGFLERVLELADYLKIRLKEYNDLFSFNHIFLKRTAHTGILTQELVARFGITGPNARATGESFDVRKSRPYSGYEKLDFVVPVGSGQFGTIGDAHDRYLVRLKEVSESLRLVRQLADEMPEGPHLDPVPLDSKAVPAGESYVAVESPRGLLGCHLVSDGSARPVRVQLRSPSLSSLLALSELMPGYRIEDLPVILASLDVSMAEVDR